MEASQIVNILCIVWVLVTLPVQIVLIISVIRKFGQFKMNKSFFIFFVVNTFVDFANEFCHLFGVILPSLGLFLDVYVSIGAGSGKYLLLGSLMTRLSQGFTCLLIAVNRCSAIIWPLRYENFWSRPVIVLAALLQLSAGIPFLVFGSTKKMHWWTNSDTAREYSIHQDDVWVYNDTSDQQQKLKIIFDKRDEEQTVYLISFVIELFFCVSLITLYVILGWVMKKRNVKAQISPRNHKYDQPNSSKRKVNQQLFKMALVICGVEITFTVFTLLTAMTNLHPNFFYALYNSLTITYSTLNAYALLACSSYTRQLVIGTLNDVFKLKLFKPETRIKTVSTTPSTGHEMVAKSSPSTPTQPRSPPAFKTSFHK